MKEAHATPFRIAALGLALLLPGCITVHIHQAPTEIETPTEAARRMLQEAPHHRDGRRKLRRRPQRVPEQPMSKTVIGGIGVIEVEKLRPVAFPPYVRTFPSIDPWGHPYLFLSTGQNYAVISTGADGVLNDMALIERIVVVLKTPGISIEQVRSECFEAESIFSSGVFLQWPGNFAHMCRESEVSWQR